MFKIVSMSRLERILIKNGLREGDEWISSDERIENSERRKEEDRKAKEFRKGGLVTG